jgi:hypothetical protein
MEAEETKKIVGQINKPGLVGVERIMSFLQTKNISPPSDKLKLFQAMTEDQDFL